MAHPLLISLMNFKADYKVKSFHLAFLLLSLLLVPKFTSVDKAIHSILENQLLHACLDFILEPLKKAATWGKKMSDLYGSLHFCYTPLAAYIVNNQETSVLSGVCGKTS